MEERVGKSPVAELVEDALGAHAIWHLRKFRLGIFSLQARDLTSKTSQPSPLLISYIQ
jgi:hypothetical protein